MRLSTIAHLDRESLQVVMQRCDPNGCWTDDLSEGEGFTPPTLDELHEFLADPDKADFLAWVIEHSA